MLQLELEHSRLSFARSEFASASESEQVTVASLSHTEPRYKYGTGTRPGRRNQAIHVSSPRPVSSTLAIRLRQRAQRWAGETKALPGMTPAAPQPPLGWPIPRRFGDSEPSGVREIRPDAYVKCTMHCTGKHHAPLQDRE
jgi:hypothetical protein